MTHATRFEFASAQAAATTAVARAALQYAADCLLGDSTGHDPHHVARVFVTAQAIARREGADLVEVELTAALHDVADFKFTGDETSGARAARRWLADAGVDDWLAARVAGNISGISFKGAGTPVTALELAGRCVQDADRLDAMGAIGIARCFAYGGATGRPLHDPEIQPQEHADVATYLSARSTSVNHFYEKLLLLKDRMNTDAGREMAERRHKYMTEFLGEFMREWDGG